MPASRLGKWAAGLLGLQLFILLSATGTGAEKPGVCPQLPETADCVKECASDDQCKDNHKCCQAGCSFVCSTPNALKPSGLSEGELPGELSETSTTTPSADPAFTISLSGSQVSTKPPLAVTSEEGDREKEGTCPSVDLPKLGLCEDQCKVDSQCPDNKKCCRNGCGKMTCTTPKF